jgi:hypothetical protein
LDPEFMCAGELEAAGADDIWRQLQLDPPAAGRPLRSADVVYNEDRYYELNGDGGWVLLVPGPLTQHLYELAATADRGATS